MIYLLRQKKFSIWNALSFPFRLNSSIWCNRKIHLNRNIQNWKYHETTQISEMWHYSSCKTASHRMLLHFSFLFVLTTYVTSNFWPAKLANTYNKLFFFLFILYHIKTVAKSCLCSIMTSTRPNSNLKGLITNFILSVMHHVNFLKSFLIRFILSSLPRFPFQTITISNGLSRLV